MTQISLRTLLVPGIWGLLPVLGDPEAPGWLEMLMDFYMGLLRAKLTEQFCHHSHWIGTARDAADLGSPDAAPQGWCYAQSRV